MKTSKRILSFFLAVVMVVTTCSVGFTAFAAENKTDSNNSYWNNSTEADEAFAALNNLVDTYLPALFNIEGVKSALEGLGMTVTEDTSISDVLAALSPTLVGALGGSASMEEVLGSNDAMNNRRYSYLNGDGNDAMNFYQLYSFCKSFANVDAGSDPTLKALKAYAAETLVELKDLVAVYSEYAAAASLGDISSSLMVPIYDAIEVEASRLIASGMSPDEAAQAAQMNILTSMPEQLGNFPLSDGSLLGDYSDDTIVSAINYFDSLFTNLGSNTQINNSADIIFYFIALPTALGVDIQSSEIMLYLANKAGTPYTAQAIGGSDNDVLTPANYYDVLTEVYPLSTFLQANGMDETVYEQNKAYADYMYYGTIMSMLTMCIYDIDPSFGAIGSTKYRDLCITILDEAGIYEDSSAHIDTLVITDEQINAIMEVASANNWANSEDYINNYMASADCVLSAQAKAIIATFSKYDRAMLSQAFGSNDIAKVKAVMSTDGTTVYGNMTLIDRINYQIPSIVCIENLGSSYNLGSPSGSIDVCKAYLGILETKAATEAIAEDGIGYNYDDYKFEDVEVDGVTVTENDIMIYAANHTLNSLVLTYLSEDGVDLGGGMTLNVAGIISSVLSSEVDLYTLVENIWLKLYEQPIETLFNLLPTLVIAIDELIFPLVLNGEGDILYGTVYSMLTGIEGVAGITQATGDTSVGLGSLSFDLNKILPAILHWLNGNQQTAIDLVGTYTGDVYDNSVPKFLNIYVADKAIAELDLEELINGAGLEADIATGLNEAISTVLGTLIGAVESYIADHGEDARYNKRGQVTQRGLNNIFVALPQLMDYVGQAFIEKYNVDSDWTAYYDGKFVGVTNEANGLEEIQNATLNNFKSLATANDPNAVLDQFVNALIGNWINSLLDFLNDFVSDEDNKIAAELPLVFGLLNALGGIGEESIISDLLNGLFQLKRSDVASFGLTEQAETGFVGFSNESGFFLLSNLSYTTESGETRGLIPLIMNLVNGDGEADYNVNNAIKATSSKGKANVAPYAVAKTASVDYSELLSAENVELAETLVDTLDGLLSSLLENTSLNGFNLDSTDNILSSVVALAATAIGQDNASDLIKLLDNYVYYVVGESKATPNKDGKIGTQAVNGNVNAKKIYTSANLSNLVIQTYSLVENIIDYLFYNADSGFLKADADMLIADAVAGIISPDSVGVRMSDDYAATAKILAKDKYLNWNDFKVEITAANEAKKADYKVVDLKYGFSAGDKDGFYTALAESLGGISAILGAVLASPVSSNGNSIYSDVLYPILDGICTPNGVTAMAPSAFASADNASRLVDGILTPISGVLAALIDAPVSMLLNTVKGLASVLDDASIKGIIGGVTGLVDGLMGGVGNVIGFASPTLGNYVANLVSLNIELPKKNIVVGLLNDLIGGAITLPNIDWDKIANAGSPAEVLLLIYQLVVDLILEEGILNDLIGTAYPEILDILDKLTATEILTILNEVIQLTQSPTEIYWTFSQYAAKLTGSFSYPIGVSASEADDAVAQLDQLVANIFPLLKELGVLDAENLGELVNGALYTNSLLTTLTKGLYGALCSEVAEGLTIADILKVVGIDPTPAGIAAYLTDKDYGKTYSSAAATLKKAKSWDDVKELNWGFTDGSAKAQQGFINGLAAALRPLNNILALFLAEGEIDFGGLDISGLAPLLDNIAISDTAYIKDGILVVEIQLEDKAANVLKIDIIAILEEIEAMLKDGKLALGTNGYENAIIPLLEAFCIDDLKTYSEYKSDYNKAKDNLLINILEPLFGFVNEVIEAPFDTLTSVLPNIGLFIDGGGITQLVNNLLAPIVSDNGLVGVLNDHGINIDELIAALAGDDLGGIIGNALGIDGLELKLTALEESNLHEILIPLVNSLLASTGIELPEIDWAQLASHGTLKTVDSAAKNADGTYKTKQVVDVNKGETLIAVLRYIEAVLINNASALKSLLGGLLGDNATVKSIVNSIFTNIGLAEEDDIVLAVFYFLTGDFTNRYFDYRDFTAEEFEFSWGSMDEDFCRQLAPMLDGLISGLIDLNGLVVDNLYKDSLISDIAIGLGKALEGVTISGDTTLDELLAMTDIDFTAANVAELLVNEDYGQTYTDAANVIKNAGSWANVNKDALKWGVTDRDSFLHALVAVLRPAYGVIDVLLNNGRLNLFNLVSVPGSDGYTSTIVPLLEALGMYNIKTQYQYREDIYNEYDAILLDIINPIFDKVEDLLAAPIQTLADILPNLSLFFANDGLIQILDNLLTPVSALLAALQPIVDVNELLGALGLDIPKVLGGIGITLPSDYEFNIYDLSATLTPLVGSENVVSLLNGVLGSLDINGAKLGIVLPEINWYQLASHGELITDGTSQAACYGKRMYVVSDQDETLIAVLRFLVNTINYENNYNAIVGLIGGLIGGADDSISGIVEQVLGMLQGDADEVIANLVDLLQTLAG